MISLKKSIAQSLSGRHAMPPHGDLGEAQNAPDLDRAHPLQVPEHKDHTFTPRELIKTLKQFGGEVRGLELPIESGSLVADTPQLRRGQVLDGNASGGPPAFQVVVDRVDGDAVQPAVKGASRLEAANVAKNFDEHFLAGILGIDPATSSPILIVFDNPSS